MKEEDRQGTDGFCLFVVVVVVVKNVYVDLKPRHQSDDN